MKIERSYIEKDAEMLKMLYIILNKYFQFENNIENRRTTLLDRRDLDYIEENVQYLHDAQRETINRNSEYYLSDGTLRIEEASSLSRRSDMVDATLTFTDNSPGHYLNNVLKWTGNWDKTTSWVKTNTLGVDQYFKQPAQFVKNDLKYVKRNGSGVWDFTSFTTYASQPQQLSVNVDTVDVTQLQTVSLSGFYTRNSTYYNWGIGHSNLMIKAALEASSDRMRSDLTHPVFTDSTRSDISADYVNVEITPAYTYRNSRFTLNAAINLRQHTLWVENRIYDTDDTYSFSFADPSVRLNYKVSPMLTLRANYRYVHSIGDFTDLTDTYFMSAYRTFYKRSGILAQTDRQSFSGGLQYRNPLTSFFFNTSLVYAPTNKNLISSQRFIGTESVSGVQPFNTSSDMWMWQGYGGKYFAGIHTNVSLSVGFNSIQGERLQQNVLYPYRSSGWSFLPKLNVKLSDDCSISYQALVSNQIIKISPTFTLPPSLSRVEDSWAIIRVAAVTYRF